MLPATRGEQFCLRQFQKTHLTKAKTHKIIRQKSKYFYFAVEKRKERCYTDY